MIASRRLYLDGTRRRIVNEGDAAAAFLLCNQGEIIDAKYAAMICVEMPVVEPAPEPVVIVVETKTKKGRSK